MPNYKQTSVTGTSYVRASRVIAENNENGRYVQFIEESVVELADGTKMTVPAGGCTKFLTTENGGTEFPLLDASGEPTGATATYSDVYLLLMSLYYHVATLRDIANSTAEE